MYLQVQGKRKCPIDDQIYEIKYWCWDCPHNRGHQCDHPNYERLLIDLNFDEGEFRNEIREVQEKYREKTLLMLDERGAFKFELTSINLVYLRCSLELYLKFPNLQQISKLCYDSIKIMIENIDSLLRDAGYTNFEIANIETPQDCEALRPILLKIEEDHRNYFLVVNPIEFGYLMAALVTNLREGMLAKWQPYIIEKLEFLLKTCNVKLRKLEFTEREIFLLNNQGM